MPLPISRLDYSVSVSPKFTVLPSNPTEVFEGESLLLDCMADGDPKPAIHWDKNSNMEGFDKTRLVGHSQSIVPLNKDFD